MKTEARFVACLCAATLLVGCAPSKDDVPEPVGPGPDAVASLIAGDYLGQSRSSVGEPLRLQVLRRSGPGVSPTSMELVQQAADGSVRRFALFLARGGLSGQLEASFAPVSSTGAPVGRCAMEGAVRNAGIVLSTDAATCRFGEGASEVGLVKEIAHDGRRLVIADRVIGATGSPVGEDRVLEFLPVRAYTGWAGRMDEAGGAWRRADEVELDSDGRSLALRDAGGMPLDVEIELAPHWPGAGATALLRLRAFDARSGSLLGQAWADPDATRLGLAVETFQIGLELDED